MDDPARETLSLDTLLELQPTTEGHLLGTIPEGWAQGRGAFGGLVVALLVRAMDRSVRGEERALRSLSAHLLAPVAVGPAELRVLVLRESNSVSTLRAELVQGGEVAAHVVGLYAAARPGAPAWQRSRFEAPAWEQLPEMPSAPGLQPQFTQHLEFRTEKMPFCGAEEPEFCGWVRPRSRWELSSRDARARRAVVALLADCFWSAAAVRFEGLRPFATIQYNLDLHEELSREDLERPFFVRAEAPSVTSGYVTEQRRLFTAEGRLLAVNNQLFVVIK